MNVTAETILALSALITSVGSLLKAVSKFKKDITTKSSDEKIEDNRSKKRTDSGVNPILKQWLFWVGLLGVLQGFGSLSFMMFSVAHPATSKDVGTDTLNAVTILLSIVNVFAAAKFANEENLDFIVKN